MTIVKAPNLPINAAVILLGEKYAEKLSNSLNNLGILPIFLPDNPYMDLRLSGHADLSVLHAEGEELWFAPYLKNGGFVQRLETMGFKIHYLEIAQSSKYPDDAQLNQCVCGRNVIVGRKSTPKEMVDFFTNKCEYNILSVNQGYVKCSVCIVAENAIITADRGIAGVAESAGLDVLLVSSGHIELSGFAYGFIGGASFKISKNQIAFTGHLDQHPDKRRILDFLRKHDVEPLFLTNESAFDIGSGIPIIEK